MELVDLNSLLAGDYNLAIESIKSSSVQPLMSPEEAIAQLDVRNHDVMSAALRPDKQKEIEDDNGNVTVSTVYVTRLPIPMQKVIVDRAAAFLCGNPIQLVSQPTTDVEANLLSLVKKVWDDNKLDYESMDLASMMMGECQCAELWYIQKATPEYWAGTANEGKNYRLRCKILAPSLGDRLFPVFDSTGDMIAFGRGYSVKVNGQDEAHFDIYTNDWYYLGKYNNGWEFTTEPNMVKKIPVIYYSQPLPEWYDVENAIKRLEKTKSNLGDTNDYFASPMITASGEIIGFADKEDQGKVLKLENGAQVGYLTWDNAPESIKLELNELKSDIYDLTDTPNISFKEMKDIGNFSGIALKMLFMAAHMKAAKKETKFGKGIQRRVNYIKAALLFINTSLSKAQALNIKPNFEYYLPKDLNEIITTITSAVQPGTAIMSQETAVGMNPLVEDPKKELELMQKEGTLGSDIQTA